MKFCVVGVNDEKKTLSDHQIRVEIQKKRNKAEFFLARDYFDDFTFKTTFVLFHAPKIGDIKKIGVIKILDLDFQTTQLPTVFDSLPLERYCSLGQGLDFYTSLYELGLSIYKAVLKGLNDVYSKKSLRRNFETTEGFEKSLLRYSEAKFLLSHAQHDMDRKIRSDEFEIISTSNVSFSFEKKMPGATKKHKIKCEFTGDSTPYERFVIITGKNGTGKTSFLKSLALTISGEGDEREGKLEPRNPSISKTIIISYSAFEHFDIPNKIKGMSYRSCSLGSYGLSGTQHDLNESILENLNDIFRSKLVSRFKAILQRAGMMEDHHSLIDLKDRFDEFSTGQRILMKYASDIVSHIEENSLIIIDEIETHLHPNYVILLLRFIGDILEQYNSFCIISTHSPIVLQEVSLNKVYIFRRVENEPFISKSNKNFIGESLSFIVNDVFDMKPSDHLYSEILRDVSKKINFDRSKYNELAKAMIKDYAKIEAD